MRTQAYTHRTMMHSCVYFLEQCHKYGVGVSKIEHLPKTEVQFLQLQWAHGEPFSKLGAIVNLLELTNLPFLDFIGAQKCTSFFVPGLESKKLPICKNLR